MWQALFSVKTWFPGVGLPSTFGAWWGLREAHGVESLQEVGPGSHFALFCCKVTYHYETKDHPFQKSWCKSHNLCGNQAGGSMLREIAAMQFSALPLLGPWLWGHGVSELVLHRPVFLPMVGPLGTVSSTDPGHSCCVSPMTDRSPPSPRPPPHSHLALWHSLPDRASFYPLLSPDYITSCPIGALSPFGWYPCLIYLLVHYEYECVWREREGARLIWFKKNN